MNRALALANAQGQVDVAARIEAVIRDLQASIKQCSSFFTDCAG